MPSSSRIPLAVVINSLESGGAENHLLGVLPRLDPTRFAVSLHTLRSGGSLLSAFIECGVRVVQGHSGRISSLVLFADEVRRVHPLVHCFLPSDLSERVALMQGAAACLAAEAGRYQARHPFAAWVSHLHQRMDALVGNSQSSRICQ